MLRAMETLKVAEALKCGQYSTDATASNFSRQLPSSEAAFRNSMPLRPLRYGSLKN